MWLVLRYMYSNNTVLYYRICSHVTVINPLWVINKNSERKQKPSGGKWRENGEDRSVIILRGFPVEPVEELHAWDEKVWTERPLVENM